MYDLRLLVLAFALTAASYAKAACDCGATVDSCTGQQISVEVGGGSRAIRVDWLFHSDGVDARCGQFANGDFWIAPAQGKAAVTVVSVESFGSGATYLDENPQLESLGLLDGSNAYGNISPAENILDSLPRDFSNDTSLVASVQRDESTHGNCGTNAIVGSCIEIYHVVTVLDDVPADAGSRTLRPSIDENVKEQLTLDDFDLERLPSLDYIEPRTASELESMRKRWAHATEIFSLLDITGHGYSEGGRAYRANLVVDDYGSGVARSYLGDLISLFSSGNTMQEKQPALASMLTYGKDLFYAMYDGTERKRNWGSGAGQSTGKYPPAVFFAAVATDPFFGNILRPTSTSLLGYYDTRGPQELEQINIGQGIPVWGDSPDALNTLSVGSYWGGVLRSQCFDGAPGVCNQGGGPKNGRDPHGLIDGPPNSPGSSYMSVTLGPYRGFAALIHLVPEVCDIVNYQPFIDYVDRVNDYGLVTAGDHCAPPDPREDPDTCDAYRRRDCEYYGLSNTGTATWGPISEDQLDQCIPNNSGGNTGQNGRFPHLDGYPVGVGYRIHSVEENWNAIRASAQSCSPRALLFRSGFEE